MRRFSLMGVGLLGAALSFAGGRSYPSAPGLSDLSAARHLPPNELREYLGNPQNAPKRRENSNGRAKRTKVSSKGHHGHSAFLKRQKNRKARKAQRSREEDARFAAAYRRHMAARMA